MSYLLDRAKAQLAAGAAQMGKNGERTIHPGLMPELIEHIDALEKALGACITSLERAETSEGCCMCGSYEAAHGFESGHSYTDAGHYYAGLALDAGRKLLERLSPSEPKND